MLIMLFCDFCDVISRREMSKTGSPRSHLQCNINRLPGGGMPFARRVFLHSILKRGFMNKQGCAFAVVHVVLVWLRVARVEDAPVVRFDHSTVRLVTMERFNSIKSLNPKVCLQKIVKLLDVFTVCRFHVLDVFEAVFKLLRFAFACDPGLTLFLREGIVEVKVLLRLRVQTVDVDHLNQMFVGEVLRPDLQPFLHEVRDYHEDLEVFIVLTDEFGAEESL
mmetsp:Transcript_41558/g.47950  ORF Transcript_41558/g.47950 Transcript_41558/m.47950 type:complete len:221 (-) Transcript_41558:1616-2278(-)